MALYDTVHDRQPEPCPLSGRLCRKEGIEDLIADLPSYAFAGVLHAQDRVIPRWQKGRRLLGFRIDHAPACGHGDDSALGHCIACIHYEVRDHLFEMDAVAVDDGRFRIEHHTKPDFAVKKRSSEEFNAVSVRRCSHRTGPARGFPFWRSSATLRSSDRHALLRPRSF